MSHELVRGVICLVDSVNERDLYPQAQVLDAKPSIYLPLY